MIDFNRCEIQGILIDDFSCRLIGWGQIRSGATIQPSVPEDRSAPIK